jgi:uncharacterized membrane protein
MPNALRTTLWILSPLAVLWTLFTIVGYLTMMPGGHMMGGRMMGGMGGGMMLHMAVAWILVLGLDGIFVYLIASSRHPRAAG